MSIDERSPEEKEFDRIEAITSYNERRIGAAKLVGLKGKIGLCASCTHLFYSKTGLGSEEFFCERNVEAGVGGRPIPIKVDGDPRAECSRHLQRGELSLYRMQDMAILIDPKNTIGFDLQEAHCPSKPEKDTSKKGR